MAINIPVNPVSTFNPVGDHSSLSQRWKRWLRGFEFYAEAAGVKDEKQKRQLLLHSAGPEVQDIFDTLMNCGEDYKTAKERLTEYFTPHKNIPYHRHLFRQEKQNEGETIAQFVTRLRQLSVDCEFGEQTNEFIRDQVIDKCCSKSLRTKLLAQKDLTLEGLLDIAQAKEASESQSAQFGEQDRAFSTRQQHRRDKKKPPQSGSKTENTDKKPHMSAKSDSSDKKGKCYKCGIKGHYGYECRCSKNIKCYKCGRMGHFASVCRSESVRFAQVPNQHVDSSSESDYGFCVNNKLETVTVKINDQDIPMIVDSGATCNIINTEIKKKLQSNGVTFRKSHRIIHPYCSAPIKASVQASVSITHGEKSTETEIICLEGSSPPLLGRTTAITLKLLALETVNLLQDEARELESRYPGLTIGVGKLKNQTVEFHVDNAVSPVARKQVRIPIHLRNKVESELKRLEKEDIIEKATGPTEWISPVVIVGKPKNPSEIRICVDMREPNKAILRTKHVTPTLDELICTLENATVFSKIDLRAGYHQLVLHPNSRAITTFATHCGLFRYKRLIFGVNAAAEIFQHAIQTVLADIEGTRNVSDDIIVFGKDQESHDRALDHTLRKLHESGLTINAQKCEFSKSKITFFGHVFSSEGISPDPEKVKALRESKTPTTASEVRSFLGMAQYSARFIPRFSTLTEPLRNLTKKDTEWQWSESEENAFREVKNALTENATTAYFDVRKDTTIYVDASPVGIAGILSQENRAIAYASRSLTAVESRYSQTEREALAVVWACEHFNMYVNGAPVTIVTDHQPLLNIWNKPNPPSLRLKRWGLRLQPYNIELKYERGENNPADFMSRSPSAETKNSREQKIAEEYINFVIRESKPKAINENTVRAETRSDRTLQVVIELLKSGQWHEIAKYKDSESVNYEALKSFRSVKDELTVSESANGDVLLRKTRLVIPQSLQKQSVDLAHEGHQGMSKTKLLVRSKVWFPFIDKMVEETVSKCIPCEANTNRQTFEPLNMSKLPRGPWLKLSIDFCGPTPTGDYLLVIVDEFSRYPVVYVVRNTSAETIMPLLDQTFAMFGYPETVKSDNGPPFQSYEWKNFLEERGIQCRHITPLWPQANAQAESFNKPMMKAIRAAIVAGENWKKALTDFLRAYRCTPHSTTLFTPYRLLFGRDPRTKLPEICDQYEKHPDDELVRSRDDEQKHRMKEYADAKRHAKRTSMVKGDLVMIKQQRRNKTQSFRNPQPLTVSKTKGSMITAQYPNGKEITRNKSFFRPTPNVPPESVIHQEQESPIPQEQEPESNLEIQQQVEEDKPEKPQRPKRTIKKPQRLIETAYKFQ